MALIRGIKGWLGERCLELGMRLLGDQMPEVEVPVEEVDDAEDNEPLPYPIVTLTEEAKAMVRDGITARPVIPLRSAEVDAPLEGSARERILMARARMEMGTR